LVFRLRRAAYNYIKGRGRGAERRAARSRSLPAWKTLTIADREPDRKKVCTRKKLRSKRNAELFAAPHDDLIAYRCRYCNGWHVAKKR
jgi:hypothetical protein